MNENDTAYKINLKNKTIKAFVNLPDPYLYFEPILPSGDAPIFWNPVIIENNGTLIISYDRQNGPNEQFRITLNTNTVGKIISLDTTRIYVTE